MKGETKIVLVAAVAIGALYASLRASERRRAEQERANAAFVERARTARGTPESVFAALSALAGARALGRAASSTEREALVTAVHAARRYGEHLVIPARMPIDEASYSEDGKRILFLEGQDLRVVAAETGKEITRAHLDAPARAAMWSGATEIVAITEDAIEIRDDDGKRAKHTDRIPTKVAHAHVLDAAQHVIIGNDVWHRHGDGFVREAGAMPKYIERTWLPGEASIFAIDAPTGDVRLHSGGYYGSLDELLPDGRESKLIREINGNIHGARFTRDGARLLVVNGGVFSVYDARTGSELSTVVLPVNPNRVAFSADERRVAFAGGGQIGVLDIGHPATMLDFRIYGNVHSLAFSPAGPRLLTASDDGTVTEWRFDRPSLEHALVRPLSAHGEAPRDPKWLSDGRIEGVIAGGEHFVGDAPSDLQLWDAAGEPREAITAPGAIIADTIQGDRAALVTSYELLWVGSLKSGFEGGAAFSGTRASNWLANDTPRAVRCEDGGGCVFIAEDGKPHYAIEPGWQPLRLSPDGKVIVLRSTDGKRWNLLHPDTGASAIVDTEPPAPAVAAPPARAFPAIDLPEPARTIRFSPDGKKALVVHPRRTLLWDVSYESAFRTACAIAKGRPESSVVCL